MYGTCLWIYTPEVGWEETTVTKIGRNKGGTCFFRAAFLKDQVNTWLSLVKPKE